MAKNWAISIGVNDYKNLPKLRFAVRDAECMKEWFEKEAGFKKVYLFTDDSGQIKDGSKPFDSQPTFATLIRFLDDRFEKPFLSSGDNLWFFFSGHGLRYGDRDYLMLSDSSGKGNLIEKTAISVSYVTERLRRAGADNVIVVQDACRNESASKGAGIGFEQYKGVITISSCSPSERSFEIEERENGSFTSVLLESLRGQHGNCATVERLNQCLSIKVPELNKKYEKGSQTPYVITEPLCKSQLILLPSMATLDDVKGLKLEAYKSEHDNLGLAKTLMNQVLIASPADVEALNWFRKIWIQELIVEHKVEILTVEKYYQTQIEELQKSDELQKAQIEELKKDYNNKIKDLEADYNKKVEELEQYYQNLLAEQEFRKELDFEELDEINATYQYDRDKLEESLNAQIKQLQQQLATSEQSSSELKVQLKSYQQQLTEKESIINQLQEKIQQLESNVSKPILSTTSTEIELKSEKGVDYTKLRDLLAAGKWKEADQETANVMLKAANRVSEGYLSDSDIDNFPCDDLRTIDQLWVHYSKGKFGFSVQKKIYMDELGARDYNEKIWDEFCDRVGWRKYGYHVSYSDLTFELQDTTLVGHLPVVMGRYSYAGLSCLVPSLAQRLVTCKI